MEARIQHAPGYYVWEVSGKPVVVHLRLDVVDRLLRELMRGFGANPKRGAEVGGVLIGTVEHGDPSIVRIEDYEPVACGYRQGPSYLLIEDDLAAFEEACGRWQPDQSGASYAVGYFRSHTREGLSLAAEDVELLDRSFPSPWQIALLVKPFATRASVAGFFLREDGAFQESTPLEFPFQRRELDGEEPPPPPAPESASTDDYAPPSREPAREPAREPSRSAPARAWVWFPLSFVFLLLGVLLGFQAALNVGPRALAGGAPDLSLGLNVSKADENLSVKWDRQAVAIRAAPRGILEIEDGSYTKSVDLDAAQLQNGNLIFRNSSSTVRFRLTVYPKARVSVTETAEWRQ